MQLPTLEWHYEECRGAYEEEQRTKIHMANSPIPIPNPSVRSINRPGICSQVVVALSHAKAAGKVWPHFPVWQTQRTEPSETFDICKSEWKGASGVSLPLQTPSKVPEPLLWLDELHMRPQLLIVSARVCLVKASISYFLALEVYFLQLAH